MRFINIMLTLALALALGACGGKGPTKKERIDAFNETGWELFQKGDFTAALEEFSEALALDSTNVAANVGLGWCMLLLGDPNLSAIIAALEVGATSASWQHDAWCGLAVANLNQQLYAEADSVAGLVLAADSSYVFTYRPQIDWQDLLVIQAQARFFTTAYIQAWQAIQPLIVGPPYDAIDPADPTTWVIGTTSYSLFEEVLAVIISALAEQYRQM
ncbi:MAG: tetratricopeptide repeat protein [Candidatus Neomarinimicrobiota bacterium]